MLQQPRKNQEAQWSGGRERGPDNGGERLRENGTGTQRKMNRNEKKSRHHRRRPHSSTFWKKGCPNLVAGKVTPLNGRGTKELITKKENLKPNKSPGQHRQRKEARQQ